MRVPSLLRPRMKLSVAHPLPRPLPLSFCCCWAAQSMMGRPWEIDAVVVSCDSCSFDSWDLESEREAVASFSLSLLLFFFFEPLHRWVLNTGVATRFRYFQEIQFEWRKGWSALLWLRSASCFAFLFTRHRPSIPFRQRLRFHILYHSPINVFIIHFLAVRLLCFVLIFIHHSSWGLLLWILPYSVHLLQMDPLQNTLSSIFIRTKIHRSSLRRPSCISSAGMILSWGVGEAEKRREEEEQNANLVHYIIYVWEDL